MMRCTASEVSREMKRCKISQVASEGSAVRLDSDSYKIDIDSCYSYSTAKHRRDFVGEMTPCNVRIKGFTGGTK